MLSLTAGVPVASKVSVSTVARLVVPHKVPMSSDLAALTYCSRACGLCLSDLSFIVPMCIDSRKGW